MSSTHSEFLNNAELRDMLGCARREDQRRALIEQGIPFKEMGRRLVVSRVHARDWLAGKAIAPSRGINWAAVR